MSWYKVEKGEMLFGDTLDGPGFHRDNVNGAQINGWRFFGNAAAAYAALGLTPKVSGPDRVILDQTIASVASVNIKNSLIAIRDNSPDGASIVVAA